MFTATFFIALSLSALAALPGDWARRNSSREAANILNLANGIVMLAVIAAVTTLGLAHGIGGVLGILSGIGTGQQLADGLANRKWGRVPARN
jgi:succinate dehydrogenase/fumarate reductase cytochrome b subunit